MIDIAADARVSTLADSGNSVRCSRIVVEWGAVGHGIRIGANVLIGANAVLLDGAHVGGGSAIGAGSVVRAGSFLGHILREDAATVRFPRIDTIRLATEFATPRHALLDDLPGLAASVLQELAC